MSRWHRSLGEHNYLTELFPAVEAFSISDMAPRRVILRIERATASTVAPFGQVIDETPSIERLPIPYYPHVEEGVSFPFYYSGRAVIRSARIQPTNDPVQWLERHLQLSQIFLGLGRAQFAIVVAEAHRDDAGIGDSQSPDLGTLRCFGFDPGTGILLSKGVWHDFPIAIDRPVTCLTLSSSEVIDALVNVKAPTELDGGDICKVNLPSRFGCEVVVNKAAHD